MRLRPPALLTALVLALGFLCPAAPAAPSIPARGRVGGVVVAEGSPQLGAIVIVTPVLRPGSPLRLVTNSHGAFSSSPLEPGLYSIRVHRVGFLPAFEPGVHVLTGQVTLLRVELGSLFSSVEQFRRGPHPGSDPHEWDWVLRSASLTRPVLRYSNERDTPSDAAERAAHAAHGRVELTTGTLAAWSPLDTQPLGSSSFLYDRLLGGNNRLVLAGFAGFERSASDGFAATWIRPSEMLKRDATDTTTVVFRQSQFGNDGPSFRGLEIDSIRQVRLSSAVELEYGGEYVVAMFNRAVASFRPQAQLSILLGPGWTASFLVGSDPPRRAADDPTEALNSLPTPVEASGSLSLDRPWHEEVSLDRSLRHGDSLSASFFHDSDAHVALFGRGPLADYDTISDPFSNAFVYDGGTLAQWGARVGYRRRLSRHWRASVLYSWSDALAPSSPRLTSASLRQSIVSDRRNLLGANVVGRIEPTGSEVSAGYEWVDGPILSRPDPYGAALFGIAPYLNVSLRQPLPSFFCCRIVALVDVSNLLDQGYVSLQTPDGRAILLPAARAFRGGFAVQF